MALPVDAEFAPLPVAIITRSHQTLSPEAQLFIECARDMAGTISRAPEFKPAPEVPAIPKALMKLPRTNITRAKFPTVDIHFHGRSLRTSQDYEKMIRLMDQTGLAVITNLDGGFGPAAPPGGVCVAVGSFAVSAPASHRSIA